MDWRGNCGTCGAPARSRTLKEDPRGLLPSEVFDPPFTREDITQLRFMAAGDGWDSVREFASNLADRIEALLQPEE